MGDEAGERGRIPSRLRPQDRAWPGGISPPRDRNLSRTQSGTLSRPSPQTQCFPAANLTQNEKKEEGRSPREALALTLEGRPGQVGGCGLGRIGRPCPATEEGDKGAETSLGDRLLPWPRGLSSPLHSTQGAAGAPGQSERTAAEASFFPQQRACGPVGFAVFFFFFF